MRRLKVLFVIALLASGCWVLLDRFPQVRTFLQEQVESTEFRTLEVRHTAQQIMESHARELLKNSGYSYLEPKLTYYPYLLMEVKYIKENHMTGEELLLWSLKNGEMVIDANTWETTHGFEDCLLAKANKNDFKILKVIVGTGGAIDREKLYGKFKVDNAVLDAWVESCHQKKLVVYSGNRVRLHFQHPKLEIEPATRFDDYLVTTPVKYSVKAKKRYTPTQIKNFTATAFGDDFAIRKLREVYLPVYTISVQNPDGSLFTSQWNALNGKRMDRVTR